MKRLTRWMFSIACLATFPVVASAQVRGIMSNLPAAGNNILPGTALAFNPGVTSSSAFDRVFLSPDGNRWILGGVGTGTLDAVITGGGTTTVGSSTVALAGQPTGFDGTLNWTSMRTQMGINNAGQFAFSGVVNAPTTSDNVAVLFNGTSWSAVAREGSVSPTGDLYGTTHDAAHILNNGTARVRSLLQTTPVRTIVNTNGTLNFDSNTTVVSNQLVAPTQTVNTVLAERYNSSGDGSRVIYRGQLNGPTATRDFVAVDNSVIAQVGAPLPGGEIPGVNVASISGDTSSQQFNHTGTVWTARVSLADTTDVVLRNGTVLARTDTPIFTGSSLNWDDATFAANFFLSASNGQGDVVVGGLVNSGDLNADAYLVFLGHSGTNFILARENDPVDLNNNGLFDDNAFIDVFGNDDGVLADDGTFYFVAALRNGAGTDIGNAFMFIAPSAVPEPTTYALLAVSGMGGLYWYRCRQIKLADALGSKLKAR